MPKDFSIKTINQFMQKNVCAADNTQVSRPPVELFPATEKPVLTPAKNLLFKTSSGRTYDLKQIICDRAIEMQSCIIKDLYKNKSLKHKIADWCKRQLYQNLTADEVYEKIDKLLKFAEQSDDIKKLFIYATGQKYSNENLEKFVKGEIGLRAEQDFKLYKNENAPQIKSAPYISNDFQENKDKIKAKGKVYKLNNKQQIKYNAINKVLDENYKQKLAKVLNYGKLTEDKYENKTVLDALHKILTKPRANGLEPVKIVQECLDILENPNIITQLAEDIPEEYLAPAVKRYYAAIDKRELNIQAQRYNLRTARGRKQFINENGGVKQPTKQEKEKYIKDELKHRWAVGTCAAASIEYDLATKQPANFFNIVEQLTSSQVKITKIYKQPQSLNSSPLLTGLDTTQPLFKQLGKNTEKKEKIVELKADAEAYNIAKIQNNHKDKHERSMIDILTQSMIMNLGSGNIYNSLTDRRNSGDVLELDNSGLHEHEVNYAKSVLMGSENNLVCYALNSRHGRKALMQRNDIKEQLSDGIKRGENIVIGYVNYGGGHEITIIDYVTNDNGDGFYVCHDSCEEEAKPTMYSEDFILSNIAHANYKKDNTPLPPEQIRKPAKKTMTTAFNPFNPGMYIPSVIVIEDKIITPWNHPVLQQNLSDFSNSLDVNKN